MSHATSSVLLTGLLKLQWLSNEGDGLARVQSYTYEYGCQRDTHLVKITPVLHRNPTFQVSIHYNASTVKLRIPKIPATFLFAKNLKNKIVQ